MTFMVEDNMGMTARITIWDNVKYDQLEELSKTISDIPQIFFCKRVKVCEKVIIVICSNRQNVLVA